MRKALSPRMRRIIIKALPCLACFLLLTAEEPLLTEEELLLIVPLLGAAIGVDENRYGPFFPFRKENRQYLLPSVLFTLLFFFQLPITALIRGPLFSESGLSLVMWPYRFLRLGFLAWNIGVLLPLSAWCALHCIARLFELFLREKTEAATALYPQKQKDRVFLWLCVGAVSCLLSTLPSVFSADTDTIWYGSVTGIWSDWHPITYRMFVKLCSLIHYSRFTVTFLQCLLFLGVCLAAIELLKRFNAGCPPMFALTLAILFTPFFCLQEMNKDNAFSAALLGCTVAMLNLLAREEKRKRDYWALGLYGYLVLSFRHGGILPLAGCVLPFLLFKAKDHKAKWKLACHVLFCFAADIVAYLLVVQGIGFGLLHAIPNPGYIKYGTPMSIVANVIVEEGPGVLSKEEQKLCKEVMPLEKWADCYTKYFPGTISRKYSLIGNDILKVEEKDLGPKITMLSIRLMLRCPGPAIGTLLDNASILWRFACPADQKEITWRTPEELDPAQERQTGFAAFTNPLARFFYGMPVLKSLSRRGGFSLFGLLFCLAVLLMKHSRMAWGLTPVALLTAGLSITIPSPSTRYVLPLMLILAFMLPVALYEKGNSHLRS